MRLSKVHIAKAYFGHFTCNSVQSDRVFLEEGLNYGRILVAIVQSAAIKIGFSSNYGRYIVQDVQSKVPLSAAGSNFGHEVLDKVTLLKVASTMNTYPIVYSRGKRYDTGHRYGHNDAQAVHSKVTLLGTPFNSGHKT